MEVPELTCPASPAKDQPTSAPAPLGAPSGQVSSHLTLGPVILPPEQGLAPTVFLKALPIPLYHTIPPGGLQPRAPLVTGSMDGSSVPFILSPLLQPEGPGPSPAGKPGPPTLTVNIVGALPVLSPGLVPTLGSLGKVRNTGRYLCPHCGRDCLKPSVLEKHIRSHTGERPFPCATCGIAFKTQSNLYKHRRTQTHLNNSRLSSESDSSRGPILDEGDKAGELPRADGKGDSQSQRGIEEAPPETPLFPSNQGTGHPLSPVTKNLDVKLETISCLGSMNVDREVTSPGPPSQSRWKLPEQRSPQASKSCPLQLQQHQGTSLERPGDTKVTEGQLRKCESTDSGYLSRSDSVEQPLAPSSPLHSLSEHSTELEGDASLGGPRLGSGEREASLELEKKQLEERIARLISHNQAVVDDSQLDNVRPRKTVLSKQGSIDLPMPYTYKDSFHFDIRALEPGRRRTTALCSTRSTLTPMGRSRPLFFHSVPTQLSTTMECVPVTRSNSLPFVEGTKTWLEPPDLQDSSLGRLKPLSPRPSPVQLRGRLGLTLMDVPSGHPRALVRQAAVEDLPCPLPGDSLPPTEDPEGNRTPAKEGVTSKSKVTGKRGSPRKLQMFSQEKWQVYGHETFQRIYQKMKSSRHGAKKVRETRVSSRPQPETPVQEKVSGQGVVLSQDIGTPGHEEVTVGAQPVPWGGSATSEGFLVTEHSKQREKVSRAGGSEQPKLDKVVSPHSLSCREAPTLGNKIPPLLPGQRLKQDCQLPPSPGPLKKGDLKAPMLSLHKPTMERGSHDAAGVGKESCTQAQSILRRASESPGETQSVGNKLPSERKKLKVEQKSRQDQSKSPGAGGKVLGSPVKTISPTSQKQDNGPEKKLETLPESTSSIPATLTEMTFPPKYLLQLPQEETQSSLPVTKGQGQDPLCKSGWPEEQPSFVGSGLGILESHRLIPALAPGGTDTVKKDPNCFRLWDRRKGVHGEKRGDKANTSTPASGELDLVNRIPREITSLPHPPVCKSCVIVDTKDIPHLDIGSTLLRKSPSGGSLNSWGPDYELGVPPKNPLEDPLTDSLTKSNPCCSPESTSFLSFISPSRTKLVLSSYSDTPGKSGVQGPFPSLKTEPQLTWCCVSQSLPLPMEQKEKATSVYSTLHLPGSSLQNECPDSQTMSKAVSERWTSTCPGRGGGQTQTWKLSCTVASGTMPQRQVSKPKWKKELPRRRVKLSQGSSDRNKLSTTAKRYKVNFFQSRTQQRVSRLRKPLWVLRKGCHLPHLQEPDSPGTLQQTCSRMTAPRTQKT